MHPEEIRQLAEQFGAQALNVLIQPVVIIQSANDQNLYI